MTTTYYKALFIVIVPDRNLAFGNQVLPFENFSPDYPELAEFGHLVHKYFQRVTGPSAA
jgi:hypothetical protein